MKKKRKIHHGSKARSFRNKLSNDEFLKDLKEESNYFENKLSNLNKIIKKKKKKIVKDGYKNQWIKEFRRLSKLQFKLEDDIFAVARNGSLGEFDFPSIGSNETRVRTKGIDELSKLLESQKLEAEELEREIKGLKSSWRSKRSSYYFDDETSLVEFVNKKIPKIEDEVDALRTVFLEKCIFEFQNEKLRRFEVKENLESLRIGKNSIIRSKEGRFLFKKIYKEFEVNNKHQSDLFFKRVKREFKNLEITEIQKYHRIFETTKKVKRENQMKKTKYNESMSGVYTYMYESLVMSSQLNRMMKIENELKERFMKRKEDTSKRLEEMKFELKKRDLLIQEKKRQQRKIEEEREKEREKAMEFERMRTHLLVEEFRLEKELENKRKFREQAILEEEMEIEKVERYRRNKERTEFRKNKIQQKEDFKKLRDLEKQEEQRKREKNLERIRNKVRKNIKVKRDPKRILKSTESSKSQKDLSKKQKLFEVHSYTNEQIFSDTRAMLLSALQNAGLHQTQAARDVFSSFKNPGFRKDMASTAKIL